MIYPRYINAKYRPGIVFIGMETSGMLRRRFQALGHETFSCDTLPSEDGGEGMTYTEEGIPLGRHLQGDVFQTLEGLRKSDLWPELAIFHPTCTYLTNSAEWAYGDGPYHQKVKPGTLVGAARREARKQALDDVRKIWALPIWMKVIENPIGAISRIMSPTQILQPYEHGDDASKATCIWVLDKDGNRLPHIRIPLDPAKRVNGRRVEWPRGSARFVERWANQTDSGQNRLSPGDDRWKDRSRTYPGIADALVDRLAGALHGYTYNAEGTRVHGG